MSKVYHNRILEVDCWRHSARRVYPPGLGERFGSHDLYHDGNAIQINKNKAHCSHNTMFHLISANVSVNQTQTLAQKSIREEEGV